MRFSLGISLLLLALASSVAQTQPRPSTLVDTILLDRCTRGLVNLAASSNTWRLSHIDAGLEGRIGRLLSVEDSAAIRTVDSIARTVIGKPYAFYDSVTAIQLRSRCPNYGCFKRMMARSVRPSDFDLDDSRLEEAYLQAAKVLDRQLRRPIEFGFVQAGKGAGAPVVAIVGWKGNGGFAQVWSGDRQARLLSALQTTPAQLAGGASSRVVVLPGNEIRQEPPTWREGSDSLRVIELMRAASVKPGKEVTIYEVGNEIRTQILSAYREIDDQARTRINAAATGLYNEPLPKVPENVYIIATLYPDATINDFGFRLGAMYEIALEGFDRSRLAALYNVFTSVAADLRNRPNRFYIAARRGQPLALFGLAYAPSGIEDRLWRAADIRRTLDKAAPGIGTRLVDAVKFETCELTPIVTYR